MTTAKTVTTIQKMVKETDLKVMTTATNSAMTTVNLEVQEALTTMDLKMDLMRATAMIPIALTAVIQKATAQRATIPVTMAMMILTVIQMTIQIMTQTAIPVVVIQKETLKVKAVQALEAVALKKMKTAKMKKMILLKTSLV